MSAKVAGIFIFVFGMLSAFAAPSLGQGSANVVLLAHMDKYPAVGYSDLWGYTAPNGREYALEGAKSGTSIVDIADPNNLVEVAFISGPTSSWREIKTYQQYAYVVNETGGGMQIIDLSNLPVSATLINTYTGFTTSHNIWIDGPAGMLYAEGSSAQPIRVISLANPTSPVQVHTFGIECHDVVVQNNLLYVSEGNQGAWGIYNVSTPTAPMRLGTVNAPAPAGYAHNCWPTPDGNYLMTTEETTGETVKMFDVTNLSSPVLTDQYLGASGLAHNVYIRENFAYIAHYADGIKIVDIADPFNIFETGFYDTNPATGGFNGVWGLYCFFTSGKIIASDIQNGLWVFFFDDGSQKPTITSTPGTTATMGQPYVYDSDNTVNALGTPPLTYSFTGPSGFNVNFTSGAVTWTPTAGQLGTHPITITATNSFGAHTQSFNITVSATSAYVKRINPGGASYTAMNGNVFVADQAYSAGGFGYVNGTAKSYTNAIANTADDPLYQTLRGRNTNFEYRFDVPAGSYNVTLHLMSPTTQNIIEDISAEGVLIYNDLNINAEAGGRFTALVKNFSTSVNDGTLNLVFTKVTRQALVCGIEVAQGSAPGLGKEAPLAATTATEAPEEFRLHQNHPNPFSRMSATGTRIRFELAQPGAVKLTIYNMLGEEVQTLARGYRGPGSYEVQWEGRQASGARPPAGVYFYRLEAEGMVATKKMILVH